MDMIKLVTNWHMNEGDGTEEEFEYCSTHLKEVESSEKVDGEYVTYATIYKDNNTGKYFEAFTVRTNVGYWGDSELWDSGCLEVVPQEVTKQFTLPLAHRRKEMTRKEIIRLAQMIYGDHYTEQDIVFGKLVANTERLNLRASVLDILEGEEDCEEVKYEQLQRYLELVAVDEWNSTEAAELRSALEQQKCDLRYVDMVIENRKWELGV